MTYYRYKRRRRYSFHEYHTDSRLNRYFAPLISDLKELFFSISSFKLEDLFLDYGEKYGKKAEQYARSAYPHWYSGTKKMSEQTLLRLVETLPYVISEQERLRLLDKLFKYHIDKLPVQYIKKTTTWDDYPKELGGIEYNIRTGNYTYFKPVDFNSEILELATWLTTKETTVAKQILSDYYRQIFLMRSQSVCNDIARFRRMCWELQKNDMVYDWQTLTMNLPALTIEFTIQPKSKSFFKTISSFFS